MDNEEKPKDRKVKPGAVKVRVLGQPVGEDGKIHLKDDEFETTPERAKALGSLVEIVK